MGLVGSKRPASYWDSDSHSLICQAGTRRPHPGGRGGGSHPHTPPGPTEGGPRPPDAPQPARAPPLSLWAGEEGSLTPPGSCEDSRFPHSRGGCLMLTITWRLLTADERPCLSSCLQWAGLSPTLDGPWHPGGLTPFWALPGGLPRGLRSSPARRRRGWGQSRGLPSALCPPHLQAGARGWQPTRVTGADTRARPCPPQSHGPGCPASEAMFRPSPAPRPPDHHWSPSPRDEGCHGGSSRHRGGPCSLARPPGPSCRQLRP